ncbi:MAG: PIN domain-containing protein [Candidatus Eremiobacterota bacterium]
MNVLIDTSVWSLALRRNKNGLSPEEGVLQDALKELIIETKAVIIGPIRQEILSGISNPAQFKKLKELLRAFEDLSVSYIEYERAAEFYNLCRSNGIQGSHIDFLICAVAEKYNLQIFTTDKDFRFYSKYIDISFYLKEFTIA